MQRLVKELKTWVDNNVHQRNEDNPTGLKKLMEFKELRNELNIIPEDKIQ